MTTDKMRAEFEAWYATESQRIRDEDNLLNRRDWRVWKSATRRAIVRAAAAIGEGMADPTAPLPAES